ncbi:DUF4422 domain-containing protein [Porcincola intestinalis]|uniref:DUF4422 domain-containing protein n=1 Tax=Porcincola intestinalis TaxID=2606632 RepID=A0A6L5X4P1_9FIRM|nr:DUF4422 domain-containing protein [Porcincola intestinalis]MSS14427.1 DUF4422 domain-containing protein [Porcincola intestinalis]
MKSTIFISCHKECSFIKNDILKPIEVGSALRKERFEGMIYDDVGDNISLSNPRYCELTAQYFAWKNITDQDYYGFFHYRRYLSFNTVKRYKTDIWGNVVEDILDRSAEKKYGLDGKTISSLIERYDIILPEKKDITKMPHMGKNMREQYLGSGYLHATDLDIMMDVLNEKYPDFVKYAEKYENGHMTYLNNMFIMKKQIFENYSQWLFDILKECDKRIDYKDYSVEAIRTPGHLAERLLNIYCLYLKDHGDYSIKELQTVAFLNTDPEVQLIPAYAEHNIAIALSANDYYVPYVSTLLLSIRDHISSYYNYDIIIMNRDISPESKRRLSEQFSDINNVSLRFLDVSKYEKQFAHLFLRGHFALETYFRLLMPSILPDYDKVLYLDSDIVVNADLAELYNEDIDGYLLAGCHDADTAGLYNGFEPDKKEYMDNVLKIKQPYEYFQAGVLLFNLKEFRDTYSTKEMLEFAASYKWQLLDQDVLNFLAQDKTKIIDMSWNVMTNWRGIRIPNIINRAPKYLRDEYMDARSHPKIIHYAGPDKPWQQPYSDYAELFWKYARNSIYYEVLIQRLAYQEAVAAKKEWRGFPKARPIVNRVFPAGTHRRAILDVIYSKIFN